MKPFFILGAPRSGTTLLRDIFKQIDGLYSPEETHFFRWGAPFRSNDYKSHYRNNKILLHHRKLDGIEDDKFEQLLKQSATRAELTNLYCEAVMKKKGASLWFEKTPQNVYGLPLIIEQFPEAKIVHIVRHPLSVIKSLLVGKVIKTDNLYAAINYWLEAVSIIKVMKPVMGEMLVELKYEMLQTEPDASMALLNKALFPEVNAEFDLKHIQNKVTIPYDYFTNEEIDIVESICAKYAAIYDYKIV
ncbi:sulfotransferase family protein [Methylophaga pinxianii]|uniref:sulfotransferase family protein n=1 Tax=Methylophaga pinxianii TaxID=2881052 RepID=UPI001CF51D95|nr:sulfotransferase [Methylophaga pinxianii]MCB2425570.1 sulfotransferase [Methylophaga pinxianii]UPH45384.1 sulfotransferase [Methylophaga pinxianii]